MADSGGEKRNREPGVLRGLFDFTLTEFVTPKVAAAVYTILVFASAVALVAGVFPVMSGGAPALAYAIAFLVAGLIWLVFVLLLRLWFETVIVLFRVSDGAQRAADAAEEIVHALDDLAESDGDENRTG